MTSNTATAGHVQLTARWLWCLATLFTLYATLIPFAFVSSIDAVREHLAQAVARSSVAIGELSRTDVVQNVLLFVPFGLFAVVSTSRTRPVRGLTTAAVGAAGLSVMCEALQLTTVNRISSMWDVYANVCGALLGGVLALAARDLSSRLVSRRHVRALLSESTLPVFAALMLVCIAALEPFDPALNVSVVWSKVKPFVNGTWTWWEPVTDEPLTALRFGMLSLLAVGTMRHSGIALRKAQLLGVLTGIMLAAALETTQFLVTSRSPSLQDLGAGVVGALAGASAASWSHRLERVGALAVLTVIAGVPFYLEPFATTTDYRSMALVPFLGYYEFTTMQTVSHVIELMLIYAPIGFAMQWSRQHAHVSTRVVLACVSMALPLELAQGWIVDRFPDVTDIAMAGLGGLIGGMVARYGLEWVRSQEAPA